MSLDDPVRMLQDLIRFRTVNPPGNEAACIRWIHDLLQEAGIESRMLGPTPERQNLVARFPAGARSRPFSCTGMWTSSTLPARRGPIRRSRA